jgi:hypothetical protein
VNFLAFYAMSDPSGKPVFATFREAYCHVYRCSAEEYLDHALIRGVPLWRRPFVLPAIWVMPGLFGIDRSVLELLGPSRSKHEFAQLLDEFHNAMRVTRGWPKRWLGLRMSGAQLIQLRDRLDPYILPGDHPPSPTRRE